MASRNVPPPALQDNLNEPATPLDRFRRAQEAFENWGVYVSQADETAFEAADSIERVEDIERQLAKRRMARPERTDIADHSHHRRMTEEAADQALEAFIEAKRLPPANGGSDTAPPCDLDHINRTRLREAILEAQGDPLPGRGGQS